MHVRSIILAVVLAACAPSTWAATGNVGVYGSFDMGVDYAQSTHGTFAGALDLGSVIFNPGFIPQTSATSIAGDTASILGNSYTASASTTLGGNHVYAQADVFTPPVYGASSFSGWYDQVTISGGSGPGTALFTVQLNGVVDVGTTTGGVGYALGTSSAHPSQLVSDALNFNALNSAQPWPMDALTPITSYSLGASPYNDTSLLFDSPTLDRVLTPGSAQNINVTLHGTLNFTYGESFYLIAGLGTVLLDTPLFSLNCSSDCPTSIDGTGATTLDFSNSAHLINIALPQGATASFASGEAYNVTAVPEPTEWLMLLAGLGLVGWRARRRS